MKKETTSVEAISILMEASQEGFEPPTDGLAYHHDFRHQRVVVCSLDYIFTISGATRVVSTEPHGDLPLRCLYLYRNKHSTHLDLVRV